MSDEKDDIAALREIPTKVAAAETAGDAETLAALWTEDGMLMDPGLPLVAGAPAIRAFWKEFFDQTSLTVSAHAEEVEVFGESAFIRVKAEVATASKDSDGAESLAGKALWITKKQSDGSWKLYRTIFNTDS